MEIDTNSNNVIIQPDLNRVALQQNQTNTDQLMGDTTLNRSSMMTYSRIVCCICSASIEANARGICQACEKKHIDISSGITKEGLIHYCKLCSRYLRPPWIKCELESSEMMALCLSKVKGLNKTKISDSTFVWTEPHSKLIKIKLTIQKEVNGTMAETSFIVEFKLEWTQCDDCKKTFTPHIWNTSVQIRQKVNHKRTFMYLEQMILKHRAHVKAINIKELPEGVDFYFANKSQANSFIDFIGSVLSIKTKQSKQLISQDLKSNLCNYKYTFMLEIAPVCKDDLILLDLATSKQLGGIGPLLLCFKQTSKLHLIDPLTFDTIAVDSSVYWRYEFKSYVDRSCLNEFLILSCNEEIDYQKKYAQEANDKRLSNQMVIDDNDKPNKLNQSTITTNTYTTHFDRILSRNKFKIVTVKCMRNNVKNNTDIIEFRTFLGAKMRPGDVYYGYDLQEINLTGDMVEGMSSKMDRIPDVVLVKKKYTQHKRIFKLKHLDMEVDGELKKNKKKINEKEQQYEEFLKDIAESKDMRKKINLYRDDKAIEELEKKMAKLDVKDKDEGEDSDTEIKIEELLGNMTLEDKKEPDDYHSEDDDDDEGGKKERKNNTKGGKDVRQCGKRQRDGEKIDNDNDNEDEDEDK